MRRRCASSMRPPFAANGPTVSGSQRRAFTPTVVRAQQNQASDIARSKDERRFREGGDGEGNTMTPLPLQADIVAEKLQWFEGTQAHISPPEVPMEQRMENETAVRRRLRQKYGEHGPGERPKEDPAQMRKDMLVKQQDADGVPWEVRSRKAMMPSPEEMVQDVRDRFELYVQDPIDRERLWYLQWNDRMMIAEPDRLIWPQGYTDFFDKYDQHGRRRHLPSARSWNDSSWKMLADTNFRRRMWKLEGEEQKMALRANQPTEKLVGGMLEMFDEQYMASRGELDGLVNLSEDQVWYVAAGSADPQRVKKAKQQIALYMKENTDTFMRGQTDEDKEIDEVTGLPKADQELLPSGLTVEEGFQTVVTASAMHELQHANALAKSAEKGGKLGSAKIGRVQAAKRLGKDAPVAVAELKAEQLKKRAALLEERKRAALEAGDGAEAAPSPAIPEGDADAEDLTETPPIPKLGANIIEAFQKVGDDVAADEATATTAAASPPAKPMTEADELGDVEESGFTKFNDSDDTGDLSAYQVEIGGVVDVMKDAPEEKVPEWYEEVAHVATPTIVEYDMLADPVKGKETHEDAYDEQKYRERKLAVNGESEAKLTHFDMGHRARAKVAPELVRGYQPLRLYKDVVEEEALVQQNKDIVYDADGKAITPAEQRRRERQMEARRALSMMDNELSLPSLPWENDPINDPNRGLAEVSIPFDRRVVESVYQVFKGFMTQAVVEFYQMARGSSEEPQCYAHLRHAAKRCLEGEVGDHAEIHERHLECIRVVFHGQALDYLSTVMKQNKRKTEAQAVRLEADEAVRRAMALAKQCGKKFVDFWSEMSAAEIENVKKAPHSKNAIMLPDEKYRPLAQPFVEMLDVDIGDFQKREFDMSDGMEGVIRIRDALEKKANTLIDQCPSTITDVPNDHCRSIPMGLQHYTRGCIHYFAGDHLWRMYVANPDMQIMGAAQDCFDRSYELFENFHKQNQNLVNIHVPNHDHETPYAEDEFLEGTNGTELEMRGEFDEAEKVYYTGTTRRWFPIIDESDHLWWYIRRGRMNLVMDGVDRCYDAVLKKTHPSIHPFPDRAKIFLEGAPLTEETAEHLWLRHVGDILQELALIQQKVGRFGTAAKWRNKGLACYFMACKDASKKLPKTWKAPLLTYAKYIYHFFDDNTDPAEWIEVFTETMDKMYAIEDGHPSYWKMELSQQHIRFALVERAQIAFSRLLVTEAVQSLGMSLSMEEQRADMESRARRGVHLSQKHADIQNRVSELADRKWRPLLERWIQAEPEVADENKAMLTHMYFRFRVVPKSAEEAEKYYQMYKKPFEFIYTNTCLNLPHYGAKYVLHAHQSMQHILMGGSNDHKKRLLDMLKNSKEKINFAFPPKELDRTINTLEEHIRNGGKTPVYMIGSMTQWEAAQNIQKTYGAHGIKSSLRSQIRAIDTSPEYDELREKLIEMKSETPQNMPTSFQDAKRSSLGDKSGAPTDGMPTASGERSDRSIKEGFGRTEKNPGQSTGGMLAPDVAGMN